MEHRYMDDIELQESLDGYIAQHFKYYEADEEFHGEKLFPGDYSRKVDKYFAIELKKILSECIDECIDKIPAFRGGYARERISKNWNRILDIYIYRITSYKFDAETPADDNKQEISPFWEIVNLRSPIYLPLFKAHFGFFGWSRNWFMFINLWIEQDFQREKKVMSLVRLGGRTVHALRHHDYAKLSKAIKDYLDVKASLNPWVATTFADILRAIIDIYQTVYPDVYYKDSIIYDRAGISRQDFSRILNGTLKPSRENVIKFINGLHPMDVPIAKILLNAAGFPMTNAIKDAIVESNKVLAEKPTSKFSETFMDFFNERQKNDKDYYRPVKVYERAKSDAQTFSKIKKNKQVQKKGNGKEDKPYQPTKNTAVSYAIALELELNNAKNDANELLISADFFLSKLIKRDVIISYFLEDPTNRLRGNDDLSHVALVNKWLERYACPILTGRKPFYFTELVFVLCNSNSMRGREKFIIEGFNSLIVHQAKIGDTQMLVSTIFTNNKFQAGYDGKHLNSFVEYNNNQVQLDKNKSLKYSVNGNSNALLDAIGNAINKIKSRHKSDPKAAPLKTVFIILSDGAKDTSSKFSYGEVKQLISAQIKSGWEFLFFAETNAEIFAKTIGIKGSCAVDYQADEAGIKKIFNAMDKFIEAARTLPLGKHPTKNWRKEL